MTKAKRDALYCRLIVEHYEALPEFRGNMARTYYRTFLRKQATPRHPNCYDLALKEIAPGV